jgi:uncharacterized membrane protein required for colicin V production
VLLLLLLVIIFFFFVNGFIMKLLCALGWAVSRHAAERRAADVGRD